MGPGLPCLMVICGPAARMREELSTGGSAPLNKEPRRNVYPLNLDDASANWGQGLPEDTW
jgi:hypothetical protein